MKSFEVSFKRKQDSTFSSVAGGDLLGFTLPTISNEYEEGAVYIVQPDSNGNLISAPRKLESGDNDIPLLLVFDQSGAIGFTFERKLLCFARRRNKRFCAVFSEDKPALTGVLNETFESCLEIKNEPGGGSAIGYTSLKIALPVPIELHDKLLDGLEELKLDIEILEGARFTLKPRLSGYYNLAIDLGTSGVCACLFSNSSIISSGSDRHNAIAVNDLELDSLEQSPSISPSYVDFKISSSNEPQYLPIATVSHLDRAENVLVNVKAMATLQALKLPLPTGRGSLVVEIVDLLPKVYMSLLRIGMEDSFTKKIPYPRFLTNLVFTAPNNYRKQHYRRVIDEISSGLTAEIFGEKSSGFSHRFSTVSEPIKESDAALFDFLSTTFYSKKSIVSGHYLVLDIGAGTTDLVVAEFTAPQDRETKKGAEINMLGHLGMPVGGNFYDACIAEAWANVVEHCFPSNDDRLKPLSPIAYMQDIRSGDGKSESDFKPSKPQVVAYHTLLKNVIRDDLKPWWGEMTTLFSQKESGLDQQERKDKADKMTKLVNGLGLLVSNTREKTSLAHLALVFYSNMSKNTLAEYMSAEYELPSEFEAVLKGFPVAEIIQLRNKKRKKSISSSDDSRLTELEAEHVEDLDTVRDHFLSQLPNILESIKIKTELSPEKISLKDTIAKVTVEQLKSLAEFSKVSNPTKKMVLASGRASRWSLVQELLKKFISENNNWSNADASGIYRDSVNAKLAVAGGAAWSANIIVRGKQALSEGQIRLTDETKSFESIYIEKMGKQGFDSKEIRVIRIHDKKYSFDKGDRFSLTDAESIRVTSIIHPPELILNQNQLDDWPKLWMFEASVIEYSSCAVRSVAENRALNHGGEGDEDSDWEILFYSKSADGHEVSEPSWETFIPPAPDIGEYLEDDSYLASTWPRYNRRGNSKSTSVFKEREK